MDNNKFLIHIEIAEKSYGIWINREEEQLIREAAKQIRNKMIQYRQRYAKSDVDVKDLLAMVALQLSIHNLQLKDKNDTVPFAEKIQNLTEKLESYLKEQ
ncbi:cell division protein ZapA [Massilibacteroides sp.]|uniref:cell division protein ZapA n=1 Tax=Massilibacteroides sp. TaxID=2034766 RepID=UPI00260DC529|nr:cell division protein ZapA [Massilibacteroides sp.]MDD4516539.1 cell division protein ZapA [Massilibacteroides sp.]